MSEFDDVVAPEERDVLGGPALEAQGLRQLGDPLDLRNRPTAIGRTSMPAVCRSAVGVL
ncbi:hypothetical protein [Streptomyces sp. 8L]|uniref:hypothetical protein n=1 Tax=Streptomyces sp. 8L TaxID=2877242 RepID=UPI001CD3C17F|nr:hypothetical protein [Streptomyces sp. 8L]MCA1220370.1 hypothetical protein [Streptomyces sp. 8L]